MLEKYSWKYFIIIGLIFSYFHIFAQDPGTVIDIKLNNKESKINSENLKDYKVTVWNNWNQRNYILDLNNDSQFHYFEWDAYRGEIFEIKIVHLNDTMNVRFQVKLDTLPKSRNGYLFNADFTFDIPFQQGYFEVTDFKRIGKSDHSFALKGDYKWVSIPIKERKLFDDKRFR